VDNKCQVQVNKEAWVTSAEYLNIKEGATLSVNDQLYEIIQLNKSTGEFSVRGKSETLKAENGVYMIEYRGKDGINDNRKACIVSRPNGGLTLINGNSMYSLISPLESSIE